DIAGRAFPAGRQVGFLAQEVEGVLPELVHTDAQGYKSVAYINLVPLLVEAIKTQQKQRDGDRTAIDALQAENAQLRAQLASLAAAVRDLQAARTPAPARLK